MSALPRNCQVLVVGAGPTGLTLAIRLRQSGVDCLLVDRNTAPAPWSRALGVQPRTLEIFDALGVLPAVQRASRQVRAVHVHNHRGLLFDLDLTGLDAPFPALLSCPQPDVERCLEEHYLALGGHLVRGVALTGFSQKGHTVLATLCDVETEQSHSLECQLLVGCDGGHSAVRQQLGVSFEGVEHTDHFLLADVQVPWSLDADAAHAFLLPQGALLALPLPDDSWRLVLNMDPDEDVGEALTLAPFQRRLGELWEAPPVLSEARWLSRFSVQRRLAGRYRVNRVLLAGDACHVQSPLGAQGMNTGIADAFNLAWKIALFLQGIGGGRLLDSYETERRPVASSMLTRVDLASRSWFSRNLLVRSARDSVLKFAGRQSGFSRSVLRRMSQLEIGYPDSMLVGSGSGLFAAMADDGPKPGERVPDALLSPLQDDEPLRLQSFLREPRHFLLVQLSTELQPQEVVAAYALADRVPEQFGRWVRTLILVPDRMPDALAEIGEFDVHVLCDRGLEFQQRFGEGPGVWLIRPDGHLAFRAHLSDGDQLLGYLREFLSAQDQGAS